MYKGDIDNTISPRLLFVFEGLVGLLPTPTDRAKYSTMVRLHQWKRAVNLYQPNEILAKHLWDITYGRANYSADCVTWLPEEMFEHVENWLDRESLPFSNVRRHNPTTLARRVATMPDVAFVYDPDPAHRWLFGSKGRLINPDAPNLMGY